MTPPPDRPGVASTVIDVVLVAFILACISLLLWTAVQVLAWGVRAASRMRRPKRWPRGRRGR